MILHARKAKKGPLGLISEPLRRPITKRPSCFSDRATGPCEVWGVRAISCENWGQDVMWLNNVYYMLSTIVLVGLGVSLTGSFVEN